MSTTPQNPCQVFFVLAMTILAISPANAETVTQCLPPPTTDAQCLECHQDKVNQELTKQFVHQPFREGKCIICHLGGQLTSPSKTTTFKSEPQLVWLAESPLPSIEHWFPLAKNQVTGDLQLDIMLPNRDVYREVIEYGDFTGLPEIALDHTPPVLTDVKVAGIEQGVLLSATVAWTTDELADTRIGYGINKPDTTAYVGEMTRSHQITIAPLKAASEYQFQVGSADYLGNLAQAAVATFSTSATIAPGDLSLPVRSSGEMTWDRQIYQNSGTGTIILKITTNLPSRIAVGVAADSTSTNSQVLDVSAKPKPCQHQLKTVLETTIDVCLPCHESYVRGGTRHPLQVGPKPGMVFPPDLFLLANGGINCMTCHSAHSSNYPNRLVKSGKEELCRGCHTDK